MSHSAEKVVAESFSVSFFLGIEKSFGKERLVMIFWSKIFCLTVTKNFVGGGNPSVFENLSAIEEFSGQEGWGELHDLPSGIFCRTVPKSSWGKVLVFYYLGVLKQLMHRSGMSRCCVENSLSHSTEKLSRMNTSVIDKFSGIENFYGQ